MKFPVLVLTLLFRFVLVAQTGPGGVGSSASNVLWLDANRGVTVSGSAVTAWADQSGNGNNAAPLAATNQPNRVTNFVNAIYPAIDFDGVNDELRVTDNATLDLTQWHVFIVVRVVTQKNYNAWLTKGNDGQENFEMLSYSDGNLHTPTYYTDGTRTFPSSAAGQVTTTEFNVIEYSYSATVGRDVYKNNGAAIITDNESKTPQVNNLAVVIGNEAGTAGRYIDAYIAEVIVYNARLNSAQRIIVNNYLVAKYNRTLVNNDLYDEDASGFDHDVAGIGRIDATNLQSDSRGSGIVRILNPADLGDNEFLVWGHDNGGVTATNTTDIPAGVQARSNRIWRVSERNTTNGAAVDVGAVDIHFDLTGMGPVTPGDLRLLIDTDNDGSFADETAIAGASSLGGNVYAFTAVPGTTLTDNRRFTIATINTVQTPLPVELIAFDVQRDGNASRLKWSTGSEKNNDYFTIERSSDAISWLPLQDIDGAGNSSVLTHYTWRDADPLPGVSYYRLRQTDFDGGFSYSEARSVVFDTNPGEVSIYPNPSAGIFIVHADDVILDIRVYSSDGRCLLAVSGGDQNVMELNLTDLPAGAYYLLVNTSSGRTALNILKR